MLVFGLCSTSDDWLGWSMDFNSIHHLSPVKKNKCSFLVYIQLLMIGWAGRWTQTHPPPLCSQKIKCLFLDYVQLLMISWAGQSIQNPSATHLQPKNKMLIFGLRSTSDDQQGWLMDLNPFCHPSSVKKIKCSFLDYIQLLMFGKAVQWTWTPSATPLQPKK